MADIREKMRTYRKLEYDFRSLPEAMPPYS